jgi:hypothetical protein
MGLRQGCLLSWIGTLLGYSLLWVTSTPHHHSLFNFCNCIASSAVMGVVPLDSKSMSRTMWTSVGVGDRRCGSGGKDGGNDGRDRSCGIDGRDGGSGHY